MDEVDIFNAAGTNKPAPDTPGDAETSSDERPRAGGKNSSGRKTRKLEFKPVYGLVVLVIATAIWVGYPMLVSTSPQSQLASAPVPVKRAAAAGQPPQADSRQGGATAAPAQAIAQGFQAPSNNAPAFADARDALEPSAMSIVPAQRVSAPVAAPTKAQIDAMIAALQQQAAEAQANQQVLLQSLAELKTAVLALKSPPAPAPPKPVAAAAAPAPSRSARTTSATTSVPRRAEPHKRAATPSAVAGLKLNTVYPGQAWIDAADGTHVVQVGDVIDGVRVLSIDPAARRVVTTNGDIR